MRHQHFDDLIRQQNTNTNEQELHASNYSELFTKFTDKGTETDYLEVKKEAKVVNILIQNVNNHTWFTKV